MKKVYRIKTLTVVNPFTIIADGYEVDQRTQILHVFNRQATGNPDKPHIERIFSAAGGQWAWIRMIEEVEA